MSYKGDRKEGSRMENSEFIEKEIKRISEKLSDPISEMIGVTESTGVLTALILVEIGKTLQKILDILQRLDIKDFQG